jgi:hypothetical protein
MLTHKTHKQRSASSRFNGHTKSYQTLRNGESTIIDFMSSLEKRLAGQEQELVKGTERVALQLPQANEWLVIVGHYFG